MRLLGKRSSELIRRRKGEITSGPSCSLAGTYYWKVQKSQKQQKNKQILKSKSGENHERRLLSYETILCTPCRPIMFMTDCSKIKGESF